MKILYVNPFLTTISLKLLGYFSLLNKSHERRHRNYGEIQIKNTYFKLNKYLRQLLTFFSKSMNLRRNKIDSKKIVVKEI